RNMPVRSPIFRRLRISSAALAGSSMGIKPAPMRRSGAVAQNWASQSLVRAIADLAELGIGDQQRHDRAVHHSRVDAVTIHVGQAERGGRRTEDAGPEHAAPLEGGTPAAPRAGCALAAAPRIPAIVAAD